MTLTLEAARRLWESLPLPVDKGLSRDELNEVEHTFGFRFNPDHRAVLSAGLPLGGRWPDWRDINGPDLRRRLAEPVQGVLFDVSENGFWWPEWGDRPPDTVAALAKARSALREAPALVPIFGHRYTPALPQSGLPVLSVVQTDVMVYGRDLADYLTREFGQGDTDPPVIAGQVREVPFWSDLT